MNPLLLNKQLKENANDLETFWKDLESWGDEMKRKEQSIASDSSKKGKIQTPAKTKGTSQVQTGPKTLTTDYSKWEKFDADLECERLEDDFKDDSELSDEFEDNARDEAMVHKEKGNSYVKAKEWDKAIDCYTKAINCYSYDPIFYANRALCYLKKNSFIAAEEDCTLSLRLDGTYVKALQRRAAAREGLGQLEFAACDLELVLSHEPKNRESLLALERVKKKLGHQEKPLDEECRPVSKFTASRNKALAAKPTVTASTIKTGDNNTNAKKVAYTQSPPDWPDPGCDIIQVKAIKKPPHLRSEKPLKRIQIAEINSLAHSVAEKVEDVNSAFKKHVIEHVRPELAGAGEPIKSAFRQNREQAKNEINYTAWPGKNLKTLKSDDLIIVERKDQNIKGTVLPKTDSNESKGRNNLKTEKEEILVPKTSVQFYLGWQKGKTLDEKYKYLKLIGSQKMRTIFSESVLEADIFSGILKVLSTNFIQNEDEVFDFLFALTQIKRFATVTMFMDSEDKANLWKLITYLRGKGLTPIEQVDNLILEYGL